MTFKRRSVSDSGCGKSTYYYTPAGYKMAEKIASSLPPGPPGQIFIGNLRNVDSNKIHASFTKISEEYGDIFSLAIGGRTLIVVNTIEAFRELYEQNKYGDLLSGRERNFCATYILADKDVPLAQNSPGYRTRREALYSSTTDFALHHLKVQYDELRKIINCIGEMSDTPQNLTQPIKLYLTALFLTNLTGEQYEYTDSRLLTLIERVDVFQSLVVPRVNGLLSTFPCLRFIPFGHGAAFKETLALTKELKGTIFDPLKESFDIGHMRGAIDCLLKAQHGDGKDNKELQDDILWESALSNIGAGTGLLFGTLLYFFVVILHKPEVCKRIQTEIDATIGRDRLPNIEDRSSMHYTEASVLELFRWACPAPILVPRRVEEDIEFRNYKIPKDATLCTNAWKIDHDESLWEEPWTYNPERFLDSNGDIAEHMRKNLILFGGGQRKCIGEILSTNTAFLFIAGVLQKFDFEAAPGDLPSIDLHLHSTTTAGIKPKPFEVVVKPRHSDK